MSVFDYIMKVKKKKFIIDIYYCLCLGFGVFFPEIS